MVNRLKGIIGQSARNILSLVKSLKKEFLSTSKPLDLITPQSDPELIQTVVKELQHQNASIILGKLQDLEKAIYHLASRQNELTKQQEVFEQRLIAIHTNLEEMLNGMEIVEENAEDFDGHWESRKGATTLN